MFVQVIEGRAADRDALTRQFDRWRTDLKPGAIGFLGSTGGITDDGRVVVAARFTDADAAKENGVRPEQSAWWEETAKSFDGDVSFADSEDVEMFLGGGSDLARFVQVIKGTMSDRDRLRRADAVFEQFAPEGRPEILGVTRVWTAPDTYVEVVYFTDEEAARRGEQTQPPADALADIGDLESLFEGAEFLDLRDPWFT